MNTTVSKPGDPADGDVSFLTTAEKYNILTTFIDSGLHTKNRKHVNVVYAVAKLQFKKGMKPRSFTAKSKKKKDSEITLIQKIEEYFSKNKGMRERARSLTIWINFSPCSNCSKAILKFQREFPHIFITIVFVDLYRISRKSCIEKGCKHITKLLESEKQKQIVMHEDNVAGLKKLKLYGVTLKTFDEQVWRELVQDVLRITKYRIPGVRKKEDEDVKKDFIHCICNNTNKCKLLKKKKKNEEEESFNNKICISILFYLIVYRLPLQLIVFIVIIIVVVVFSYVVFVSALSSAQVGRAEFLIGRVGVSKA